MQKNKKYLSPLGITLFSIGIFIGMVMFFLMNWANLEAYFYFGYSTPADKNLTSLRCPLLITPSDTGKVTIRISNETGRDLEPSVETDISSHNVTRSEENSYLLTAGQTRKLGWNITSDDIVFGHLILAHVFVHRVYTLPSCANTCGTLVVNLGGLNGNQLFVVVLVMTIVCLAIGWSLWQAGNRSPLRKERIATMAMAILTGVVLLGILAGCIGWWGVGIFCGVGSILLIITVIGYYVQNT
jgi:hypothetical protein